MSNLPDPAPTMSDLLRRLPQDATAAQLQAWTGDRWVCWYGHITGHYWGMPRHPYPWRGVVEGVTPEALAARMTEVDAYHGHGRRP
ncbi:hypothetical protein ACQEU6_21125 [Spirillospora sp. CA-108201]